MIPVRFPVVWGVQRVMECEYDSGAEADRTGVVKIGFERGNEHASNES